MNLTRNRNPLYNPWQSPPIGCCINCGRPIKEERRYERPGKPVAYVYGIHDYYGCDTGCCGTVLIGSSEDGAIVCRTSLDFMHRGKEVLPAFAHQHGAPIREDLCAFYCSEDGE